MVDRFLYGIDPEFESGIEDFLETVIGTTGEAIVKNLPRASRATKAKLASSVKVAADSVLKIWREKMVPTVKDKFKREVQDMIYLMPKQDLAALAQELINLTSVKRGFVWVRRKHYFEPRLNPRYFHRKFGSTTP